MCGIAGFCNPRNDFMQTQNKWISILETMNRTLKRRGPDDEGLIFPPTADSLMYGLKLLTY